MTEGHDTMADLEAAVAGLARSLGVDPPLIEPLGPRVVAGWLGSRSRFDSATLDELRVEPGVARVARLAIGEPRIRHRGLPPEPPPSPARSPGGHACGELGAAPSTRYRRVALRAMATVDPDQARDYVVAELGSLAGRDDLSIRLAATLRVFFEDGASHRNAAQRLGIHENTVRYRVRQAEDLLGRSVDERTLDLRVALALCDVVDIEPTAGV